MRKVVIVDYNTTLKWVLKEMTKEDVNSVLVVNKEWELVWSVDVVTLMKTIVPEYIGNRNMSVAHFTTEEMFDEFIKDNKDKKVKYFMLETPKVIKESSTVLNACITATEWRQTRIPIVDTKNKPIWVVTRRWVRKYLSKQMEL